MLLIDGYIRSTVIGLISQCNDQMCAPKKYH